MIKKFAEYLAPARRLGELYATPLVLFAMRFYVARVFFTSGWEKLGYVRNNELGTLYNIFEAYHVPFLPVKVATWLGMGGEISLSILLLLGLFARFGALGLIVMSCVIYNTDGNPVAAYWILICALIAAHGPGRIALDNILCKEQVRTPIV